MTIYLVRHGEAAASWQHNPDPALSEQGRAQAQSLLPFFAHRKIEHLISSPLLRTRETALPLGQSTRLAVQLSDAFREIPTPVNISLENRLAWLQGCANSPWSDAGRVLLDWRHSILQSLRGAPDNTVIFTHFMVMNAVVGELRGAPNLVCYQPDYCSVVSLERQAAGLHLISLGQEAQSRVL